jgi:hypothetical protein
MKRSTNPLRHVLVLVPVLAALVVVPATSAGPAVVLDEPIAFPDDNPCTGEPVAFTGTVHHVMTFTTDSSGGIHLDDNLSIQASGISATLVSYTMSDRQFLSINLPSSQGAEETVNITTRITRAGESFPLPDDYTAQFFIHFTINSNGVPTAETTKGPGSECR